MSRGGEHETAASACGLVATLAPFAERAPMGCWLLVAAVAGVGAAGLLACVRQAALALPD